MRLEPATASSLTIVLLVLTLPLPADADGKGKQSCPPGPVNLLAPERTSEPAEGSDAIQKALTERCPGSPVVGPRFRTKEGTFLLGLGWDGQREHACMALLMTRGESVTVIASGQVPVGWSDRYGEASPPQFLSRPVQLPGLPPFPLLKVTTMGAGGGGGSDLYVVEVLGDELTARLLGGVDGARNINTFVETQGLCVDRLTQRSCWGRTVLRLDACFDGERLPARYFEWVDGTFRKKD
jgi:hypothetical protein